MAAPGSACPSTNSGCGAPEPSQPCRTRQPEQQPARTHPQSGRNFPELLRDLVLNPAGMDHSTYEQPLSAGRAQVAATGTLADGSPIPGGWRIYPERAAAGLWSTPTDLSQLAIELVRSMRNEPDALLGPNAAAEMMRPQLGKWGLGVELTPLAGARKFSHTGAPIGYRTLWLMYPDTCDGATIMTNADEGMTLAYEVARALADTHGWPEPMASDRTGQVSTDSATVRRFAGKYQLRTFPEERFDVKVEPDGRLSWSRQGRGKRDLVPVDAETLVSPDSGMTLRIVESGESLPNAELLELTFGGGINIARRVP